LGQIGLDKSPRTFARRHTNREKAYSSTANEEDVVSHRMTSEGLDEIEAGPKHSIASLVGGLPPA
jgi:hypothetical protein